MNYIKQFNGFWSFRRQCALPATAQSLWYSLTHAQNAAKWAEEISLPSALLRHWMGDVGEEAFRRARSILAEEGLLTFRLGKRGMTLYRLKQLYENEGQAADGADAAGKTGDETDAPESPQELENQERKPSARQGDININPNVNLNINPNSKEDFKPTLPAGPVKEARHGSARNGGNDTRQTGGNAPAYADQKGRAGGRTDWDAEAKQGL